MRLRMRRPQLPPIAADLGSSGLRFLQLDQLGRGIAAASEQALPSEPFDVDRHLAATDAALADLSADRAWTGRRVVVALPAELVSMMHLRLESGEDLQTAVQSRMPDAGVDPLVRSIDVSSPFKSGRGGVDVLCLAMPRETVLRYVGILHGHKFDIAGVYAPASMIARAFQHVNRREADVDACTMYIDLSPGRSTIAFAHGPSLVAARTTETPPLDLSDAAAPTVGTVPVAAQAPTDGDGNLLTAINRRVEQAAPSMPPVRDSSGRAEIPPAYCDELRMCMRHHQSLFGETPINRVVFTGQGALAAGPCRGIAQALGLPAQVGDPLARWDASAAAIDCPDWHHQLRPQWTVAAGLATESDEEHRQ